MIEIETGPGGLERVVVAGPRASGELYLQGAHCTAWQPAGHDPVLWMSEKSYFAQGKPIRGGVPICFPWFGPHPTNPEAPAHGNARTTLWQLISNSQLPTGGYRVVCRTTIAPFDVQYEVCFDDKLNLSLSTELPENHNGSARFEDALHTYLRISQIDRVSISGLEGVPYIDKVGSAVNVPATGQPITFSGETDRVYQRTKDTCVLHDPGLNRQISIHKSGSNSTVVWNPWIAKSARMPDFGDDEWPGMLCIETANVGPDAILLQPGQRHTTTAIIEVRHLTN